MYAPKRPHARRRANSHVRIGEITPLRSPETGAHAAPPRYRAAQLPHTRHPSCRCENPCATGNDTGHVSSSPALERTMQTSTHPLPPSLWLLLRKAAWTRSRSDTSRLLAVTVARAVRAWPATCRGSGRSPSSARTQASRYVLPSRPQCTGHQSYSRHTRHLA